MSNLNNLSTSKLNNRLNQITNRINDLTESAHVDFNEYCKSKKILGKWSDMTWKYQNRNIFFTKPFDRNGNKVTSKTPKNNKVIITGLWAELLRIHALASIKKGKTAKATTTEVTAITWLCEYLSYEDAALLTFKQSTLDSTIPLLEEHFIKRGPFERLKEMVRFTKTILIPNSLVIGFSPKVTMVNPALAQADITTEEYKKRRNDKYNIDIDKYLGQVKNKFEKDNVRLLNGQPCVYPEPKEHYDEFRLLAIPFLLVFGLRIGELCRLTDDCLQFDEINERWYLTVLTEKGELPSPRPVPRLWEKIIVSSYERILEITRYYRNDAHRAEKLKEQYFIDALNFDKRPSHITEALQQHGFAPELHFFRSELGKRGDTHSSGMSFAMTRGEYADAAVGTIRCKGLLGTQAVNQLVYSKSIISDIAFNKYQAYRQIIYRENYIDDDTQGSISSESFEIVLPFNKFLFIAKDELFNAVSNGHGFIPKPLTTRNFVNWITNDTKSRNKTVFERYDIRDDDGNIVSINSHQFRHWLTTALMRSGKNEMMVDIFMGRTPGQSRHYDHRTPKERAEALRARYTSVDLPDDTLGRRVKRMRENNVSLDEIETAINHTLSVVHYTPWGTCKRDLDVSPCEKGMMCLRGDDDGIGCQHFGINPEDEEARKSIINTKIHYENQLSVLLPNYQNLMEKLNKQEPLDQHIQYCIDTLKGCDNALAAYDRARKEKSNTIQVVEIYTPPKAEQ